MRHAVELLKQLHRLSAGVPLPFVLRYKTDGGPDHNMSFVFAVLSLIGLLRAASFDALFARHPAPDSSCRSEGEHGMVTLNTELQH